MTTSVTGPAIWQALANARGPAHELFAQPREGRAAWLRSRLAAAPPELVQQSGDGLRLPGREGQAVPAAVLIALLAQGDEPRVVLTQRSEVVGDHAGQISFPGGRCEGPSESPEDAALREAEEEIGLPAARVQTLGRLAPYETITGYRVTPVIGWIEEPVTFLADPGEVASVFEVPLRFLLDPTHYRRHRYDLGDKPRHYFSVPYEGRYIWGATAAMLLMLYHTLLGAGGNE